jgi:Fe(3+) dicitrate transport protein
MFKPDLRILSAAAILCGVLPHTTMAQDSGIPTVEVIGTRDRLPEIAGSATLLDAQELQAAHVFTISEALRKAPGVHVRDEDGFALRPNIGIRGLNPTRSTKVLLLEDGLPLAYAPYGDNASYYHPPVERFERIEILKGSEQIRFGPQTIGGVVNYITPDPPREFAASLNLAGGTREYFNGSARLGGRGMLLDVTRKQGDGARDNESTGLTDFNFKAVHEFDARHAVTLRASYYLEDSDVGYTGITDAELRNFGWRYNPFDNDEFDAERWGASLTHAFAISDAATLTTSAYGTHFSRDWWRQASTTTDSQCLGSLPDFSSDRNNGIAVDPDACLSTQGRLRDYYTWGVEPRLAIEHALFGVPAQFQTGFRAHFETQDRRQKNGTTPFARDGLLTEDNERDVTAWSVFMQNRFLFDRFTLTPGLRVEYVDAERHNDLVGGSGDTDLAELIPALGATFDAGHDTTLFADVYRGFAPPRTEDLINNPSGPGAATYTDVDAELSWIVEAGLRSTPRSGVNLEATWFRNDFDNQIAVGSIAGGSIPLAEGESLYEGLELAGRLDSDELADTGWNAYAGVSWTWLWTAEQTEAFRQVADGVIVDGSAAGNRLPYAPEHLFTGTIGFTAGSGWDLRLEAVRVDAQYSDFSNTVNAPVNGDGLHGRIKPYLVFNLAATYPVPQRPLTVFLAVKNLGDSDYIVDRTRGIRVGMPLLVQGGIEIDF